MAMPAHEFRLLSPELPCEGDPSGTSSEAKEKGGRSQRVRLICPKACIIEQVTQSGGDLPRIDADSFLAEPEGTGPTPYVPEEATMKLACERLCENVGTTLPKV